MASIIGFPGSFNPILNSHCIIAQNIASLLCAKNGKVMFIPDSNLYGKKDLADDMHRYKMIKRVVSKNPKFDVSYHEIAYAKKYKKQLKTYDSLCMLKKLYPDKEIRLLTGSDNFLQFDNWYKPNQLINEFSPIIYLRKKEDLREIEKSNIYKDNYKKILIFKEIIVNSLASSDIRDLCKIYGVECVRYNVPDEVWKYIVEYNLYKGGK